MQDKIPFARRPIWFAFVLLVVVSPLAQILPVAADVGSLWVASGAPSFEEDGAPTNPNRYPADMPCDAQDVSYLQMNHGLPSTQTTQACVAVTPYGLVARGNTNFLQFAHDTQAYALDLQNSAASALGIPGSNLLLESVITSGFGNDIGFYTQPVAVFKKVPDSQYGYKYQAQPPTRWLKNTNGQNMVMRTMTVSANGKWLLGETTGNTLTRVNLDTFQMLTFSDNAPAYGIGLNPSLSLAISNDGRYVAMSGSNVNKVWTFDLATCSSQNAADMLSPTAGCGVRDMTTVLQQHVAGFRTANYMHFSADDSELTLNALSTQAGKSVQATLTAAGVDNTRLDYLALGDSFSSGEGDTEGAQYYAPGTDTSNEKCHLSTRSYPYLVARQLGLGASSFKNVACSGAVTEDIVNESASYQGQQHRLSQYGDAVVNDMKEQALKSFLPGRAAQIQFVEKYKPKLITISIGGNDVGFSAKLRQCLTSIGYTCDDALPSAQRAADGQEIAHSFTRLKQVYAALHAASPQSKIYVVGYPQIVQLHSACPVNVGLDDAELTFVDQGVRYLNQIIQAAAQSAGVGYLDVQNSLNGQTLCTGSATAVAVNGLTWGDDIGAGAVRVVGNESFHPNERGQALIAGVVVGAVPNLLTASYCADTSSWCPRTGLVAPALPSYFQAASPPDFWQQAFDFTTQTVFTNVAGQAINLAGSLFAPGSSLHIELHSTPIDLGTYITDASGNFSQVVQLPSGVPPGYHLLHVYGASPDGQQLDLYQEILVTAPSRSTNDADATPQLAPKVSSASSISETSPLLTAAAPVLRASNATNPQLQLQLSGGVPVSQVSRPPTLMLSAGPALLGLVLALGIVIKKQLQKGKRS